MMSGSGEANFDSFESNPFQNSKQRQEQEVQTLLQKLSHEMIGLDASFVGTLDKGTTQHLAPSFCFLNSEFNCELKCVLLFLNVFLLHFSDVATLKLEHQAIFNTANSAIVKVRLCCSKWYHEKPL